MIIFSHPKPFRPDTIPVQTLAFRSWREAFPDARIILFGNEKGTEAVCHDLALEFGGPVQVEPKSGAALVSHIFQKIATLHESLNLFINSDIVLGGKNARTVARLHSQPGPWLASGRRYCLAPFQAEKHTQAEGLQTIWASYPRWGHKTALDYFLWKDMEFTGMPAFVIGHCAWDNWMIWSARMQGTPVYDMSREFSAFHFDHGYSYSLGNASQTDPAGFLETYNLALLGNEAKRFHLGHATHEIDSESIRLKRGFSVWQRKFEVFRLRKPAWENPIRYFRQIFHLLIRCWERATDKIEDWDRTNASTPAAPRAPIQQVRARININLRRIVAILGGRIRGPVRLSTNLTGDVFSLEPRQCIVIPESKSVQPRPHPYFGTRLQKYDATWVASLQGLEVYGPTIAVVEKTGALIPDVSIEWGRKPQDNWTFRRIMMPRPANLTGKSLILASTGGETYFHWMTNVLPRFQLAQESGFTADSFDHILINEIAKPFQRETLARLGIALERCRVFGQTPLGYRCETAVLPSLPEYPGNITLKTCRFLRSLYPPSVRQGGKRLYISRGNRGKRSVIEHEKILNYLGLLNFETHECSLLSVKEQAQLFSSAEIIVIAHGAAATNLVFCQPGTIVIELFGPGYVNPCYRDLCAHLGLVHSAIIGNGHDWKLELNHIQADSPITASLELLKRTLHDIVQVSPVRTQEESESASKPLGFV